jgi:endoglucanase
MEVTNGRFAWSGWEPEAFKAAYRKFVGECRAIAPNVAFMWSPKGLPNLAEYYPGDDVVDLVGLSIFGLQAYDQGEFGHNRTFAEILKPAYDEAVKLGRPIWVAELGYVGDRAYVEYWAKTVEQLYPQFPKLAAVVYFNDKEVYPWPKNYGLPNWRVNSNIVSSVAMN